MIQIILVSHGKFCEGLLGSLEMVTGEQEGISAVPLLSGEAPEDYREKLRQEIEKHDTQKGVLILSDVTGGTPFNSTGYLAKDYEIGLVSGMNMPMLVTLVFARTKDSTLDELIGAATDPVAAGIKGTNLSKGGKRREKLSINKN